MKQVVVAVILAMSMLLVAVGTSAQENDAWIPGIASFVIPGLGQVLNDQISRGIVHFGVDVAIWALGFYGAMFLPPLLYATPALHLGWAIYSGLDAYNVAKDQGFSIGLVENGVGFSYSF
jgi:hypothetical protein